MKLCSLLFFLFFQGVSSSWAQVDIDELFKAHRQRFLEFDKRMQQMFEKLDSDFGPSFEKDDFIKKIETTESTNEVHVSILVEDLKNSNVTVNVKDGVIELKANVQKEVSLQGGGKSFSSYQVQKSFPVPETAENDNAETKIEDNKIVLTFKKTAQKPSGKSERRKIHIPNAIKI